MRTTGRQLGTAAALLAIAACVPAVRARADEPSSAQADAVGFAVEGEPAQTGGAAPGPAGAGGGEAGFDDVSFGSASGDDAHQAAAPMPDGPPGSATQWTVKGLNRTQSAMRLERGGPYRLGKLRQIWNAQVEAKDLLGHGSFSLSGLVSGRAEADFAVLMHQDRYDAPTRELYEWQLVPWENYLKARLSLFELTVGNQIVSLGQGEVLSVIDIVNPRDLREPLLSDFEDLKMATPMVRATLGVDAFRFELMWLPLPYFGLLPPPTGEFSPFRKLLSDDPVIGMALEGRTLRNTHVPGSSLALQSSQFHAQVSWSGPGIDLAAHFSDTLDALGVPKMPDPAEWVRQDIAFALYHPRYRMIGLSGATTVGPFLLRFEAASELSRPLTLIDRAAEILELSTQRYTTARGMLGVTYVPNSHTNASLEISQSYVAANPAREADSSLRILFPVEATQFALRLNHSFLRERASLSVIAMAVGLAPFNGAAARLELGYALFESLELRIGGVLYVPTQNFGFFYGFERNDRVFANLRWTFSATP